MHLILTGATGLVGSAALDALIKNPTVTRISILSRRPVPMAEADTAAAASADPRVRVIMHSDYDRYDDAVLDQLRGAEGCIWALGISQNQVGPDEYVRITKDYTLAAARAFGGLAPPPHPFRFVYISGEGATQSPGMITPLYGRVKGETETELSRLYSSAAFLPYSIRPGYVDASAHESIRSFIPVRQPIMHVAEALVGPVLRTLWKSNVTPTTALGRFMVDTAMGRWDTALATAGTPTPVVSGLLKVGDMPVIRNQAVMLLSEQTPA